jgi:catechol 2,3-dioxygenase-like lactoylglutathione lyase family enzyme
METTIDKKLTTLHLSLNVSDLARSIDFYQKVFGMPPAKRRADYAKFELEDPPLALSLEPSGTSGGGPLNHVGFRLSDAHELVDLQRRLEVAGLSSIREEGVECCYARQTKFWLQDPDKILWEFYVLEADIECAGDRKLPETAALSGRLQPRSDLPHAGPQSRLPTSGSPAPVDWEHHLGSPFPRPLPFKDQSLKEIRLRGTFNVPCESEARSAMLAECLRALAPGGRVVLHHLTAEAPLPPGSLPLPGPAAVVKEVPVDTELLAWLEEAAFGDVQLLKFSGTPSFTLQGVQLRETIVQALRPPKAEDEEVLVIYKGPLRQLVDDAGRVFRRGRRAWISAARWELICSGPLEESFVRLRCERPVPAGAVFSTGDSCS